MSNNSQMISKKVETYLDALEARGYLNASVLVGYKGEILLSKGYGMANVEHEVPNTQRTKFRVGSITKGFTGLAIVQLAEQGLLQFEDAVDKYLPDYPNGEKITIHHLLTHTSGIPNYAVTQEFWDVSMRLNLTMEQTIALFKDKPLDFSPGERWSYTNSGYILLSYIIEKVSGQEYGEYVRENILKPLEMNDSGYDNGRPVIKQMASSYSFFKTHTHPEHEDLSLAFGAYGLYSTVEDLYKWDRALYTDRLVSKEGLERMFTPYMPIYGGYGWHITEQSIAGKKRKRIGHVGDVSGFVNNFVRYIDEDLVVIVLSNLAITPVEQISSDLASIVLGEEIVSIDAIEPRVLDNCQLEQYVGTYVVEGDHPESIQITLEENRLYVTAAKRYGVMYKIPLIAIAGDGSEDKFVTEAVDETIAFHKNNLGQIVQLVYRDVYRTTKSAISSRTFRG